METKEVIPNQVFIGLPWTIKKKYEKIIDKLNKTYPLSFIIIGREEDQDAVDLFELIKTKIDKSSYAIFDATGGNANVSLEYGYSEAISMKKAIYYSDRKLANEKKDKPIISDIAGKKRKNYKIESQLASLLRSFSKSHPYTLRFEKYCTTKLKGFPRGKKKTYRTLSLKIIHQFDDKPFLRRDDVVQTLLALDYSDSDANEALRLLHQSRLIVIQRGNPSKVSIA